MVPVHSFSVCGDERGHLRNRNVHALCHFRPDTGAACHVAWIVIFSTILSIQLAGAATRAAAADSNCAKGLSGGLRRACVFTPDETGPR